MTAKIRGATNNARFMESPLGSGGENTNGQVRYQELVATTAGAR